MILRYIHPLCVYIHICIFTDFHFVYFKFIKHIISDVCMFPGEQHLATIENPYHMLNMAC